MRVTMRDCFFDIVKSNKIFQFKICLLLDFRPIFNAISYITFDSSQISSPSDISYLKTHENKTQQIAHLVNIIQSSFENHKEKFQML